MRNFPKWVALATLALGAATALAQPAASQPATPPAAKPAAQPASQPATQPAGPEDLMTTIAALKTRLRDQDNRLAELEAQQTKQAVSMAQIAKDMASDAGTRGGGVPNWLDRLKFAGDVRLRYEGQWFDGTTKGKLTPEDYDRMRYRLRFGFTKEINEDWSLGFRLETGNGTDPYETNQTLTGDFVRNSIFVDQAWIQYKPKALNGELTVVGGRFAPPFVGTDMTLDPDVTMSGVSENWTHKCNDDMTIFATLGQLFLEENRSNGTPDNAEATALMAYQLGARTKLTPEVTWTSTGMFWQYFNVDRDAAMGTDEAIGQANNIPLGNSLVTVNKQPFLAAENFEMVDFYTELAFRLGANNTPFRVFGDVVWNVDDQAPKPYKGQDFAGIMGVALGKINWKKGDWEIGYNYRYVQADSMIAVFSDNSFWGTDKQGHTLAARYSVADNVTLNFKYVQFGWLTDKVDPDRSMVRVEVEARF